MSSARNLRSKPRACALSLSILWIDRLHFEGGADFSIRGMHQPQFRFHGDVFDRIERDLISDGDAMDGCYRARACLH